MSAPRNVGRVTDAALDAVPDRVALVVPEGASTYRQLEERTRQAAAALARAGVGPGDRVAQVAHGGVLSVATVLAAARLGAAAAQMNAYLLAPELARLADLAGARVGVAARPFTEQLAAALDGPVLTEADLFEGPTDEPPGDDWVPEPEASALILYTSGTTGLPKPIPISHQLIADRLAFYAKPIDPLAPPAVDLLSVPIFHIAGTLGTLIGLSQGRQIVVLPRFDAGTWLELVERHRVTQTFVVPTMLRRILEHPDFPRTDLSSLHSLSYGAAACPTSLIRRALAALPGVEFSNTFGQTETLGAYAALTPEDHRRGGRFDSVGRTLAGVELRVVEPGTERDLAPGEVGEFLVRAVQNTTTDWLHTGDTGRRDAQGYLYLSGRLSDTINRGGEKIGPLEVEEVLLAHPSVTEAGVTGVPDEDLGERVGAVVVTSAPTTVEELLDHCAASLATFKVPEYLVFAEDLPVTALGKPDRPSMRARLSSVTRVARPRP